MPKRVIFIGLSFLILLGVTVGRFYFKNLRGLGPAVKSPAPGITSSNTTDLPLKLPPNFSISIYARDLGNPRVIIEEKISTNILVSLPQQGKIIALPDANKDGIADSVITLIDKLNYPHGLQENCPTPATCQLYVAETDAVLAFDYDPLTHTLDNQREIISLPSGGNHQTRTLLFVPHKDKLLISIGSSCNVCEEKDHRRAAILQSDLDGSNLKVFAQGLRNAVFLKQHPLSADQVWVTEMGRDLIGDDIPPDEINLLNLSQPGKDYGWPYCYGANIPDTNFDPHTKKLQFCQSQATPAYIDLPAHSAPLGLDFFPQSAWPAEFHSNLLVAYHGSWNRTVPTGYKVVRIKLDSQGKVLGIEDFIAGWLTPSNEALGRPVDILINSEPAIYISDDKAGVIYKLRYTGKQ